MKKQKLNRLNMKIQKGNKAKKRFYFDPKQSLTQARNLIVGGYHEYFIKKMIDNIANDYDAPLDKDGSTLLIFATKQGMYPVVEYLILKGASPNKADNFGNTPLHYAFQFEFF